MPNAPSKVDRCAGPDAGAYHFVYYFRCPNPLPRPARRGSRQVWRIGARGRPVPSLRSHVTAFFWVDLTNDTGGGPRDTALYGQGAATAGIPGRGLPPVTQERV